MLIIKPVVIYVKKFLCEWIRTFTIKKVTEEWFKKIFLYVFNIPLLIIDGVDDGVGHVITMGLGLGSCRVGTPSVK